MVTTRRFPWSAVAVAVGLWAFLVQQAVFGAPPATVGELRASVAPYADAARLTWAPPSAAFTVEDQTPDPEPGPAYTPFGNFVLYSGARNGNANPPDYRPPTASQVPTVEELKRMNGGTIRMRPQWLSVNGKWDFSYVDMCVANHRKAGRPYTLLPMHTGADPTTQQSRTFYLALAKELGARYGSDPLYAGVHPGGASAPPNASEEQHWGKAPWPKKVTDLQREMYAAFAAAHPGKYLLWALGTNDQAATTAFATWAEDLTPGRFLVKHNAMKASTDLNWIQNKNIAAFGKAGAEIGFEMVGPSSNASRFGGTWQKMLDNVSYIAGQAGKPPGRVYLARYPGDIDKPLAPAEALGSRTSAVRAAAPASINTAETPLPSKRGPHAVRNSPPASNWPRLLFKNPAFKPQPRRGMRRL